MGDWRLAIGDWFWGGDGDRFERLPLSQKLTQPRVTGPYVLRFTFYASRVTNDARTQVRLKLSVNEAFSLSARRKERAGERRSAGSGLRFPTPPSLQLSPHSFLAGREGSQSESLTDAFNRTPNTPTICISRDLV